MSFLEQVWEHIRDGRVQNHPYPVALNVNMAYTVMLPDRETHLIWLPWEYTGLCYKDQRAFVNIHPYYHGVILEDVELSHGTDLYKPKTDQEFMKKLYNLSWEIECSIRQRPDPVLESASAADYILKMYHFAEWLRYYNSAATPRRNQS